MNYPEGLVKTEYLCCIIPEFSESCEGQLEKRILRICAVAYSVTVAYPEYGSRLLCVYLFFETYKALARHYVLYRIMLGIMSFYIVVLVRIGNSAGVNIEKVIGNISVDIYPSVIEFRHCYYSALYIHHRLLLYEVLNCIVKHILDLQKDLLLLFLKFLQFFPKSVFTKPTEYCTIMLYGL